MHAADQFKIFFDRGHPVVYTLTSNTLRIIRQTQLKYIYTEC